MNALNTYLFGATVTAILTLRKWENSWEHMPKDYMLIVPIAILWPITLPTIVINEFKEK